MIYLNSSYDEPKNYMFKMGKNWTVPGMPGKAEPGKGWRIIEEFGSITYCYSSVVALDNPY